MSKAQSDSLPVRQALGRAGFSGKVALILATWFGAGLAPAAPGTFGTLAGVPLVLLYGLYGGWSEAFVTAVVTLAAVWSSGRAVDLLGRGDPPEVVIDEVAGLLVTMFLVPVSPLNMVLGFILFRFFDIVKPWPVRQAEALRGGYGVVADDLLSGVYAHICLRGILLLVP